MQNFFDWMHSVNEAKKSEIRKIGKSINRFNRGERIFDDIFGNKKRIVVPIPGNTDADINMFLRVLKNKFNVKLSIEDLKSGKLKERIETRVGPKDREMNIGKFLQNKLNDRRKKKEAPESVEFYEELLKFWSIVKDKAENMSFDSGYSVIISRYPTDVLRMSDHKDDEGYEIHSCFAKGGAYYSCAVREAQIGGAVAYAVKNQDLQTVHDVENASEIFRDSDRDIKGIFPLERLKLRRFTLPDEAGDILIPELKTYPLKIPGTKTIKGHIAGFKETVTKWAWSVQKEKLESNNVADQYEKITLRGGSYIDSSIPAMWETFFGHVPNRDEKESIDQDEQGYKPEDLDITPKEWERRAKQHIEHNPAFMSHDQIHWSLSGSDETANRGRGFFSAKVSWSFPTEMFARSLSESDVKNIAASVHATALIKLENPEAKTEGNLVTITVPVKYGNEVEEGKFLYKGTLHSFYAFADNYVAKYAMNYDRVKNIMMHYFFEKGIAKNQTHDLLQDYEFRHFKTVTSDSTRVGGGISHTFIGERFKLGSTKGINLLSLGGYHEGRFVFSRLPYRLPLPIDLKYCRFQIDNQMISFFIYVMITHTDAEAKKKLDAIQEIDNNWTHYERDLVEWWSKIAKRMAGFAHQMA